MSENKRPIIAILGCGTMGSACGKALRHTYHLHLYDRTPDKARALADEVKAKSFTKIEDALKNAEAVILAFKPKDLDSSSPAILNALPAGAMIVSLLATIPLSKLHRSFPHLPIVRFMPNIAAEYSKSSTALCDDGNLDEARRTLAEHIASCLGNYAWITEELMPGFIALAGSGPAFHFVLIEAMVEAGVALGFKPEQAQTLVLQALQSSVAMLEHSGDHPSALKWRIATPGGTTIAGLLALEQHNVRNGIIQTILATAKKAE